MGGGASRGVRPERSGGRPWRGSVVPVGTIPRERFTRPHGRFRGTPWNQSAVLKTNIPLYPFPALGTHVPTMGIGVGGRGRGAPGRPAVGGQQKEPNPLIPKGEIPSPGPHGKTGRRRSSPSVRRAGETSRNKSDAAPGRRRSRPRTGTTRKRRPEGEKKAQKKAPSTAPCGKSIASPDTRSAGLREKGKRKGSRHTTSNVHRPPFQGPPGGFLTGAPVTILPNIQLMLLVSANSPGSGCSLDVRIPLVRPRNRIASRM